MGDPAGGCLLLHGFSGSPLEMTPLAEALAGAGWEVSVVRLAGHGTSPDDLARVSWEDWVASARHGYRLLRACCPRVGLPAGAPAGRPPLGTLGGHLESHAVVFHDAAETAVRRLDGDLHVPDPGVARGGGQTLLDHPQQRVIGSRRDAGQRRRGRTTSSSGHRSAVPATRVRRAAARSTGAARSRRTR